MITRRTLLLAILSLATLGGCGQHTATPATDTVPADGAPTGWPHITSAVRREPAMEARVQHLVAGMALAANVGKMTQAHIKHIPPEQADPDNRRQDTGEKRG